MKEIKLHFKGPFTFIDGPQSVFYSEQAKSPCIYLWTIRQKKDNSHYIHYVGETVSLVKRQREHLIQILGLNYGILIQIKQEMAFRNYFGADFGDRRIQVLSEV